MLLWEKSTLIGILCALLVQDKVEVDSWSCPMDLKSTFNWRLWPGETAGKLI